MTDPVADAARSAAVILAGERVPCGLVVQAGDVCLLRPVAAVGVHRGLLNRVGRGVQQGPPGPEVGGVGAGRSRRG